ncbi:hypothetical protein Riv7116_3011 [Rivularia sp. PCC 7116]|uniref:DUF6745 domain-containing protein n=1 Tax=Rivularia sp. PCC 7116 TaxID=373994 RepID=UPI00029EE1FF|nr:hypothetical protein [Rivularia sp. PCC 7116]AFY55492.1 hypothetical protein Riv7116_3011 [Rivularia sp. PCC 7116]
MADGNFQFNFGNTNFVDNTSINSKMTRIHFLAPEQEAQIPEYQQKWKSIYLSTQPIQRNRAKAAVQGAYAVMGKPEPEVIFCASPLVAIEQLKTYISQQPQNSNQTSEQQVYTDFLEFASSVWENIQQGNQHQELKLGIKPLEDLIKEVSRESFKSLNEHIDNSLPRDLTIQEIIEQMYFGTSPILDMLGKLPANQGMREFFTDFENRLPDNWQESLSTAISAIEEQLAWLPGKDLFFREWLKPMIQASVIAKVYGLEHSNYEDAIFVSLSTFEKKFLKENPPVIISKIAITCIWLDFAFSVLGYPHTSQKWAALQGIIKHCGWIFAVDNLCIICDRPIKILVDDNNQLHGEGEPAIEFADGFVIYTHHGTPLPDKYGTVHPNQWQSQWVIEETNQQLKAVLMNVIGAVRLCQELPVIEIDSLQEYKFLKFENIDINTYILQRINSQNGNRNAVFVPQHIKAIRLAIEYANQNCSAEDFPIPSDE